MAVCNVSLYLILMIDERHCSSSTISGTFPQTCIKHLTLFLCLLELHNTAQWPSSYTKYGEYRTTQQAITFSSFKYIQHSSAVKCSAQRWEFTGSGGLAPCLPHHTIITNATRQGDSRHKHYTNRLFEQELLSDDVSVADQCQTSDVREQNHIPLPQHTTIKRMKADI